MPEPFKNLFNAQTIQLQVGHLNLPARYVAAANDRLEAQELKDRG